MKNKSIIICTALTVIMALFMTGCSGNNTSSAPENAATVLTGITVMGEGATVFDFTVTDKEGNETPFEIHTDKETVGEALSELGLIEGEEGAYGLYVKTVNGITADYDTDGTYWAFYINGEYALAGIDSTAITEGESYSMRIE